MAGKEQVCGILGGMGPEATVDFLGRIVRYTEADEDNDHVHCIVEQNPKVPSRIKCILHGDCDPGPTLAAMARNLQAAGADFLCMPCNTAHNWLTAIQDAVSIPCLDMPALAIAKAAQQAPGPKCGIMGTTATKIQGVYEPHCARHGMEAIYPDDADQAALLAIINEVKAGDHSGGARFARIAENLAAKGATSLILACTELSVLGLPPSMAAIAVDALDALTEAVVVEAGAKLKRPRGRIS